MRHPRRRLLLKSLLREALAPGLDRDDAIVRRRLRQKMHFIVGDAAPGAAASGWPRTQPGCS